MSFFLTDPPVWSAYALDTRKEAHADIHKYPGCAKRQSWCKLTSNVVYKNSSNKFIYPSILMGGNLNKNLMPENTTVNYSYDKNRNVPMPGVISIDVDFKGTKGGLREIKVGFRCWNMDQLSDMEKLFMSLGKSVVVEWGWNTDPEGNRNYSLMSQKDCELNSGAFYQKVIQKQESADGCYDAAKGLVSNFNWSLADDGGFNCDITLISMAEALLTTSIKESHDNCENKNSNDDDDEAETDGTLVQNFRLLTENSEAGKSYTIMGADTDAGSDKVAAVAIQFDAERTDEQKEEDSGLAAYFRWVKEGVFNTIASTQTYISWDAMEELASLSLCSEVNVSFEDTKDTKPKFKDFQNLVPRVKGLLGRADSRNSIIRNHTLMSSMDPSVCILPGQEPWKHEYYEKKKTKSFENLKGLEALKPFTCKGADKSLVGNGGSKKGFLSNIQLNLWFLREVAKDAKDINEFLEGVIEGVNNACGSLFNLIVTSHPYDSDRIMVIDVDTTKGPDNPKPKTIPIFGSNSIAREVNLNTEVSNDIKAQIMYGSNRNTAKEDKNGRIYDEYDLFGGTGESAVEDRSPSIKDQKKDVDSDGCIEGSEAASDVEKSKKKKFSKAVKKMLGSTTTEKANSAVTAMKSLTDWPKKSTAWSPPILPITFSFKMDGFSGLEWGNIVIPNYIPKRYGNPLDPKNMKVFFMVTKVKQSISAGDWVTEVETIMRVKN